MIYTLATWPLRILRTVRTAFVALRRNLMRAVLTTLGIIIGIAAVITTTEIGGGLSRGVQASIAKMGANNLMVIPGAANSGGQSWGQGSQLTLTAADADAIAERCDAVAAVAPIIQTAAQVIAGNHNWNMNNIFGTTPRYLDVRQWHDFDEGGMFSDIDVRNGTLVCVIGQTIKHNLFDDKSPIGQQLRIQNVNLSVVGVLKSKGANMFGMDQDDIVIVPWRTVKYRLANRVGGGSSPAPGAGNASAISTAVNTLNGLYPSGASSLYPTRSSIQEADSPSPVRFSNINQIQVTAKSPQDINPAMEQIAKILRTTHRLREGQDDDFQIKDMREMSDFFSRITGMLTLLLLAVATISLIVGGVGIMNIMLVSVTERTREIGLRMAVGARSRDILLQFLVESVVLCVAGGAIGIALGEGASFLVNYLFEWPAGFSPLIVIVAFVVAASVGMTFGFYPAFKASRLDPIEALRYE